MRTLIEPSGRAADEALLEGQFHESRAQLAFLKARVETARPDVEGEYFSQVEALERLQDVGLGRMEALKTAPDEFWHSLLGPARKSCDDLRAEISATRLRYFPSLS